MSRPYGELIYIIFILEVKKKIIYSRKSLLCHYSSSVYDLNFVHFQYVLDPLFFKILFGGTCFNISRSVSISTVDAIEFNNIKHFKVVSNAPKTLNSSGVRIEIVKKERF